MTRPLIEVSNLCKFYGSKRAVHNVSFTINQGEVVGFLGRNGAGKSSTLRMLSCLTLPSSGRIVVDGIDASREPRAIRARIGYLPDVPPLYGEMTVHGYLEFAACIRGMDTAKARIRVEEVEEQIAIKDVRFERTAYLSHGYKQRVGIAQAIVHRPALLILDEPTSGLDPAQVVEMRTLILSLESQHTVLLSSHILPEVSLLADRLLVMHAGRIVAQGDVRELSKVLERHRVVVVVRGNPETAVRVASSVDGVAEVAQIPNSQGVVELHVLLSRDVRPNLARALIEAGLDLVALERAAALESIFIAVTDEQYVQGGIAP